MSGTKYMIFKKMIYTCKIKYVHKDIENIWRRNKMEFKLYIDYHYAK